MRQKTTFPLAEGRHKEIKKQMLDWASQFSILIFLDSNEYASPYGSYECLLAVDPIQTLQGSLDEIQDHHSIHRDWLFGHICYDYKNDLEGKLESRHPEVMGFSKLQFFRPGIVCSISTDCKTISVESIGVDPQDIWAAIIATEIREDAALPKLSFTARTNKQEYLSAIGTLRQHIADGDCYEVNYCTQSYCEQADIIPLDAFKSLNAISPAPFAAYYRLGDRYMMCSSPERYLKKNGDKLVSQPIKGTARRSADSAEDEQIRQELSNSIKERAENVMITDLTRNDLARVCETGSIEVEELFGIYTYPRVHQMISTITGKLRANAPFTDALRYSFPMGSMTGAPKIMVMQLIDKYEHTRRELYAGTIGYITPKGDFDFNVIIRSLFYNQATQYLSYQAGGAITYDSDAEQEWQEMRLKASAMEQVFR